MNTAEFILALFDADPSGEAEVVISPVLFGLPVEVDWVRPEPGMICREGSHCTHVSLAISGGEAIMAGLASLKAERDALAAQLEGKLGIAPDGAHAPRRKATANVGAFILKAPALDRLLLVRSRKPGRAWELPGGAREPEEGVRAVVVREVAEETGVAFEPDGRAQSVEGCVVFRGTSETERPTPGGDADEARWVTRTEASLLTLSDLPSARLIREWLDK